MEFLGTDTNLCAQTIFKAVGKSGRGIDHHRAGIHLTQEAHCVPVIVGDDGIGVARAVLVDVGDGVVDVVHHFYRQGEVEVLGVPVILYISIPFYPEITFNSAEDIFWKRVKGNQT